MDIDNSYLRLCWQRLHKLINYTKWIVGGGHEHAPHDIEHRHLNTLNLSGPKPVTGSVGRIVCGADQSGLFADVVNGFLLIKNVITGGHHINSRREQLLA